MVNVEVDVKSWDIVKAGRKIIEDRVAKEEKIY
jgi:histidine ammonia-lyase